MGTEDEKRLAAARAVALVETGMTVGLGTGSTAAHAIQILGQRVREGLAIRGVPTSEASTALARTEGIPLVALNKVECVHLAIDGADEVDRERRCIKGGGGALLREKIVASAADRMVVIVDSGKTVERLGTFPLPVETVPFACEQVRRQILALGASVALRADTQGPFVTDEGNRILDCRFGAISDAPALAARLDAIVGIVGHGLFIDMVDDVIVGSGNTASFME
ncbi:MAG: ribose-5-phosphate isomerase RpiA [Alphaproteobacteria bacterium]|nr:ribose-5-phosphate isomerase RpiA [Alphaproteobacteria bacterium]MCY4320123.1 ribose-5-phosphate isomerase RpiA [Alphaproteobacteria bacterium]